MVGPEEFYPFFNRMRATFSEMHVTIHDRFAEDDKVSVCGASFGSAAPVDDMGMPPTNTFLPQPKEFDLVPSSLTHAPVRDKLCVCPQKERSQCI
jgi:hypothetical protein